MENKGNNSIQSVENDWQISFFSFFFLFSFLVPIIFHCQISGIGMKQKEKKGNRLPI